jgi:hypothetical protein
MHVGDRLEPSGNTTIYNLHNHLIRCSASAANPHCLHNGRGEMLARTCNKAIASVAAVKGFLVSIRRC